MISPPVPSASLLGTARNLKLSSVSTEIVRRLRKVLFVFAPSVLKPGDEKAVLNKDRIALKLDQLGDMERTTYRCGSWRNRDRNTRARLGFLARQI